MLFNYITPSHKSEVNSIFEIISKLTAPRLILSRSTLRRPISSLKNVILLESSSIKIILSLANMASSSFLINLLVTNQSETKKQTLMLVENDQQLYHAFLESYSIQDQIALQKDRYRRLYRTFLLHLFYCSYIIQI